MISSKTYPKSILNKSEQLKKLTYVRKAYIKSKFMEFLKANHLTSNDVVLCGGASLIWADRIYTPIVKDVDILLPIGFSYDKLVKVSKCDVLTDGRYSYLRSMRDRAEKVNGVWCLSKHDALFACAHAFINKKREKAYEEPRIDAILADYTETDLRDCYHILNNDSLIRTEQDASFDEYIRAKLREREDELCQINQ